MKGVASAAQQPRIYLKRRVVDGLNHILGEGATQSQLAKLFGVSQCLTNRIVSGYSISQQTAVKIAHALSSEKKYVSWKEITEVRYE